ncbi:SiaC family regulatory phosphoprotein [Ekhidna sp.]
MNSSVAINKMPLAAAAIYPNSLAKGEPKIDYIYSRSLNIMMLRGESKSHAHTASTYHNVINQAQNHLNDPEKERIRIYVGFESFNTDSYSYFIELFEILNLFHKKGKDIKIYWSYKHSKKMCDAGVYLLPFCDFPFEIVDT